MTLGPDGGCIYAPKSAALAAALPSTAYLQPNSETAETSKRANPDLFLFHCNYNEAMEVSPLKAEIYACMPNAPFQN